VPDADDTAGALLALARLGGQDVARASDGLEWLLGVQNRDGGWPTFCRGWGKLPFDRSAPDLTAHALRAIAAWRDSVPARTAGAAVARGFEYLRRTQRPDGSWAPLWFGNQYAAEQENPVYGTARVLAAYAEVGAGDRPEARKAVAYLVRAQSDDGGWGGDEYAPASVEETALAVEALSAWLDDVEPRDACLRGGQYLVDRIGHNGLAEPAPIGLYFARLWYSEKLYPIIWSVAALGSVLSRVRTNPPCVPAADQ